MAHPDGNIAFFNDSALEIAPNLNELKKYPDLPIWVTFFREALDFFKINNNYNKGFDICSDHIKILLNTH